MKIFINNQEQEVNPSANILDIIANVGINSLQGMALAVNDNVIAKKNWGNLELKEGDKILLIRAASGG